MDDKNSNVDFNLKFKGNANIKKEAEHGKSGSALNALNNNNLNRPIVPQQAPNNSLQNKKLNNNNKKLNPNAMDSNPLMKRPNQFSKNKNKNMSDRLASKGLQKAGLPKGASDKLVNSKLGQATMKKVKEKNPLLRTLDKLTNKRKEDEDETPKGVENFRISKKTKRIALVVSLIGFTLILIICMFYTIYDAYMESFELGLAEDIARDKAEDTLNKALEGDKKSEEAVEKAIDSAINSVGYNDTEKNSYILYSNNFTKFASNKLLNSNFVLTTIIDRPYNDADLTQLREFYGDFINFSKENTNENMVKFYFKLYEIYTAYDNKGVALNLPLLMSTLMLQSDNKSLVFESNVKDYEKGKNIEKLNYDYNWSNYAISRNDSSHDMEILAQRMVSKDSNGQLKLDDSKYKEFLKEFIEKKYFLDKNGKYYIENTSTGSTNEEISNPYAAKMIELALSELDNKGYNGNGIKYNTAMGSKTGTPWCANFVSWLAANTRIDNKSIYPDLVPFKSASTGALMRNFNNSSYANVKFHYNDNCNKLKGKNSSNTSYEPKPGDYIFFDWGKNFNDISSNTQDHTGLVIKYQDGVIYTIEGNINKKIYRRTIKSTDCRVIGFGSWY